MLIYTIVLVEISHCLVVSLSLNTTDSLTLMYLYLQVVITLVLDNKVYTMSTVFYHSLNLKPQANHKGGYKYNPYYIALITLQLYTHFHPYTSAATSQKARYIHLQHSLLLLFVKCRKYI
jgi:hypothetical protein